MADLFARLQASNYVAKYELDDETQDQIESEFQRILDVTFVESFFAIIASSGMSPARLAPLLGFNPGQFTRWRDGQRPDLTEKTVRDRIRQQAKTIRADLVLIEDDKAHAVAIGRTMALIKRSVMSADPRDCAPLNGDQAFAVSYVVRYVTKAVPRKRDQERAFNEAIHWLAEKKPDARVSNQEDMKRLLDDWFIPYMIFDDAVHRE